LSNVEISATKDDDDDEPWTTTILRWCRTPLVDMVVVVVFRRFAGDPPVSNTKALTAESPNRIPIENTIPPIHDVVVVVAVVVDFVGANLVVLGRLRFFHRGSGGCIRSSMFFTVCLRVMFPVQYLASRVVFFLLLEADAIFIR